MSKSRLMSAAMIPIGITLTFNALAQVQTELCTGIDGSGSVSATDFAVQKSGLAAAISDPTIIPQNGTVAVAVVQFSSSAQLEVARTVIDSAATATAVATAINGITQLNDLTAIGEAIQLCAGTLEPASTNRSVIDISTDGGNNTGVNPSVAADAAITAGVNVINAIGVGAGIDLTGLQEIVRPQPAKLAPPYDDGFYIVVTDFTQYSAAIADKIRAEVAAPQPIPAVGGIGLGVLAMLFATFGFRRLRGRAR